MKIAKWLVPVALFWLAATIAVMAQEPPRAERQAAQSDVTAAEVADPIDRLIEALKDDAAREKLINALQANAPVWAASPGSALGSARGSARGSAPGAAPSSAAALPEQATEQPPLTSTLSTAVQHFAKQLDGFAGRLQGALLGLGDGATILEKIRNEKFLPELLALIATIAVTFATHRALTYLAHPAYAYMERLPFITKLRWARLSLRHAGGTALRAGVAILAYATGFLAALVIFSDGHSIERHQALFLNAFLIAQFADIAVGAFLSPRHPELRMVHVSDQVATFAYNRASVVIVILCYGLRLLSPLAAEEVSFLFSRGIQALTMVVATFFTIAAIWRTRAKIAADRRASPPTPPPPEIQAAIERDITAKILRVLGYLWPWLATLYVLALFGVAIARPIRTLPFLIEASAWSFIAVLVGVIVVALLTKAMRSEAVLPQQLRGGLPKFETRVTKAAPRMLMVIRFLAMVIIAPWIADIWGLFDFVAWAKSAAGSKAIGGLLTALITALLGYIAWLAAAAWVEYKLSDTIGVIPTARERTLLPMIFTAVTIVTFVMITMIVLSELGFNIAPLLAGAGVVGLAIGFGAQTLVRDIITGIFIQLESALNKGDVVTVAGTTGTVEKLSLRCVNIRDLSGTVHVVPFSEVTTVSNFMRDYGYHVASIGVAYKENIDVVKAAIGRAFQRLKAVDDQRLILDDIAIDGVTELGDNAVVVRARIKTKPGYQWTIGRQFTEFVKVVFDEEGIEIPFPHLTLATAIDKIGAPLLTIADNRTEKKENFSAKPQPKRRKDGKDSIDDRES